MARLRSASPDTAGIRNMMGGAAVKSNLPPIPSKISTAYGSPVEAAPKPTRRRAGASIKEVVNDIIVDARSDANNTSSLDFSLDTLSQTASSALAKRSERKTAMKNTTTANSTRPTNGTASTEPASAAKAAPAAKGKGKRPSQKRADMSPDPISEPSHFPSSAAPPARSSSRLSEASLPIVPEEGAGNLSPSPLPDHGPGNDSDASGPGPMRTPSPARSDSPKHPRTESDEEEASQSPPLKKQRSNIRPRKASTPYRSSRSDVSVDSSPVAGHRFPGTPSNTRREFDDADSILGDLEAHSTPSLGTPVKAMSVRKVNPLQEFSPGGHIIPPKNAKSYSIDPMDGSITFQHAPPSKYDPIAVHPSRRKRRIRYPLPGTPTHSPGGTRRYYSPPPSAQRPSTRGAPQDGSPTPTPNLTSNAIPSLESGAADKGKGKDVEMTVPTPTNSLLYKRPPTTYGLLVMPEHQQRPRSRSSSPSRDAGSRSKRDRSPIGTRSRGPEAGSSSNTGKRPDVDTGAKSGLPTVELGKLPQAKPAPSPVRATRGNKPLPPRGPSAVPDWLLPEPVKVIPRPQSPAKKPAQEPPKVPSVPLSSPDDQTPPEPSRLLFPPSVSKGPVAANPMTWATLQKPAQPSNSQARPNTSGTGQGGAAAPKPKIFAPPAKPTFDVELTLNEQAPTPATSWWLCLTNFWPFKRHAAPRRPRRETLGFLEDNGFVAWLQDETRTFGLTLWTSLMSLIGGIWGAIISIFSLVGTKFAAGMYMVATWISDFISASIALTYDTSNRAYTAVRNAWTGLFGRTTDNGTQNIRGTTIRPGTVTGSTAEPSRVKVTRPPVPTRQKTTNSIPGFLDTRGIDFSQWLKPFLACALVAAVAYMVSRTSWDRSARRTHETHDELFQPEHSFSLWPGSFSGMWASITSLAYSVGQYVPSVHGPSPSNWFSPTESAAFNKKMRGLEHSAQTIVTEQAVQSNAIDRLETLVPKIIHRDLDAEGRPIIHDMFYFALRDLMNRDEEVLTLQKNADGDFELSEPHYQAVKAKFEKEWAEAKSHSEDGGAPVSSNGSGVTSGEVQRIIDDKLPASWDNWVSRNQDRVKQALDQAGLTGDIAAEVVGRLQARPGNLVTREQFLAELREEFAKHSSQVMTEVYSFMKRTGDGHLRDLVAAALRTHGVDDLSMRRIEAIVEDKVRYILGSAGLKGLSKSKVASIIDNETGRGVNFFAVGTGAIIHHKHTSPQYEPKAFKHKSEGWRREYRTTSPPPVVALKPWDDFGDCWCGKNADSHSGRPIGVTLSVQIAHSISPDMFVIEHIPATRSLEPDAVPNEMELWAYVEDHREAAVLEDLSQRFFDASAAADATRAILGGGWVRIGHFTYRPEEGREGAFVYKIPEVLREAGLQTDHVVVRAVNNVGNADHTCIYRVKLFGAKMDTGKGPDDPAWP